MPQTQTQVGGTDHRELDDYIDKAIDELFVPRTGRKAAPEALPEEAPPPSSIGDLQESLLSLDWEISAETLQAFEDRALEVKEQVQGDEHATDVLEMALRVCGFLCDNIEAASPHSIQFLHAAVRSLDLLLADPPPADSERDSVFQNVRSKFDRLKAEAHRAQTEAEPEGGTDALAWFEEEGQQESPLEASEAAGEALPEAAGTMRVPPAEEGPVESLDAIAEDEVQPVGAADGDSEAELLEAVPVEELDDVEEYEYLEPLPDEELTPPEEAREPSADPAAGGEEASMEAGRLAEVDEEHTDPSAEASPDLLGSTMDGEVVEPAGEGLFETPTDEGAQDPEGTAPTLDPGAPEGLAGSAVGSLASVSDLGLSVDPEEHTPVPQGAGAPAEWTSKVEKARDLSTELGGTIEEVRRELDGFFQRMLAAMPQGSDLQNVRGYFEKVRGTLDRRLEEAECRAASVGSLTAELALQPAWQSAPAEPSEGSDLRPELLRIQAYAERLEAAVRRIEEALPAHDER